VRAALVWWWCFVFIRPCDHCIRDYSLSSYPSILSPLLRFTPPLFPTSFLPIKIRVLYWEGFLVVLVFLLSRRLVSRVPSLPPSSSLFIKVIIIVVILIAFFS